MRVIVRFTLILLFGLISTLDIVAATVAIVDEQM